MLNLPIDKIVIHCSYSPHRGDTAAVVHKWHREKGWQGIGYHWVIREDGTVEAGRPEYWIGAHVGVHNYNEGSIGIMLFGIDGNFTDEQYEALEELIGEILKRHPTIDSICGHYQLDNRKTCPQINVPDWLESVGLDNYQIS